MYCFMKLVSDIHVLTYALGLNVKVPSVLCYNPKILKHCFWRAFVHHLVRLPTAAGPTAQRPTSSCRLKLWTDFQLSYSSAVFTNLSLLQWLIHNLLLTYTKDCLLEQTNVLSQKKKKKEKSFAIPAFFSGLEIACSTSNCLTMNKKSQSSRTPFLCVLPFISDKKKTPPESFLK